MSFVSVVVFAERRPPPSVPALLCEMVESPIETSAPKSSIPPPIVPAPLYSIVLWSTVSVPLLSMPPPDPLATLCVIVECVTVSVPGLSIQIPPPTPSFGSPLLLSVSPPWISTPLITDVPVDDLDHALDAALDDRRRARAGAGERDVRGEAELAWPATACTSPRAG